MTGISYFLIALVLIFWLKQLVFHPFFILFVIIIGFGAQIAEPVYKLDIENKTTLSFVTDKDIKQKVHPFDTDKGIMELNTFNFRQLLEKNPKSYWRHKAFPLNQRDKCYADLDIASYNIPVLLVNEKCANMRSAFWDCTIKWVLILLVIWPLANRLVALLFMLGMVLYLSALKFLPSESKENEDNTNNGKNAC